MLANTTGSFKIKSISQIANTSKISREPILSEQQIFQGQQIYQISKCIKKKNTSKIANTSRILRKVDLSWISRIANISRIVCLGMCYFIAGILCLTFSAIFCFKKYFCFWQFFADESSLFEPRNQVPKKRSENFSIKTPYAYADKCVHKIISVKIENVVNEIQNSAKT